MIDRRNFIKAASVAGVGLGASSLVAKTADRRPNILVFFPDQHRHDWLGVNPAIPVRTPNLDALGQRGVRFTNALCPSPVCAPSRACLASGKEYDRCCVPSNNYNYPLDQTTVYSLLRQSGYQVTACGKLDLHKKTSYWGFDGKYRTEELGFSDAIDSSGKWDGLKIPLNLSNPYNQYLARHGLMFKHFGDYAARRSDSYGSLFNTPLPDHAYCDNWVGNNGLELIERAPQDRPWFLQINFPGPHEPMDVTESMDRLYQGVDFPQPNNCAKYSPDQHVQIRRKYAAMIENIDRMLGLYVQRLKERGELDNTLIIWSSDHGEMLGDHDRWAKVVPYQPSVGVPLVVAGPGIRQGAVINSPTTTMDLAATFLDYAGVSRPSGWDSISLGRMLEGRAEANREYVRSGIFNWCLVFDGRYKLITGFDPHGPKKGVKDEVPPLLFDLEEDPLENENVAQKRPEVIKGMMGILQEA